MSPAAPPGSPRACGDSGSHGAEVPRASAHPSPEPPLHPVAEPPQHPQPPRAGPWRPGPVCPSPVPTSGCARALRLPQARPPGRLRRREGTAGPDSRGARGARRAPRCPHSPVTLSPRDSASPDQHSGAADPLY